MTGTTAIIDAVVNTLTALTWTPAGGADEPLFGSVRRHSSTDMESAFRTLLLAKQRAAIVVFAGNEFEEVPSGTQRRVRRVTHVSVAVTDRVVGNADAAVFGSASTPGALGLADLVAATLIGRVVANPAGIDLVPRLTGEASITDDSKPNLPGRSAAVIEIDAIGGMVASASRPTGPIA